MRVQQLRVNINCLKFKISAIFFFVFDFMLTLSTYNKSGMSQGTFWLKPYFDIFIRYGDNAPQLKIQNEGICVWDDQEIF